MNEAELLPVNMVIKMLGEGVINNFYWGTPSKVQANKVRNNVNLALNRAGLNENFKSAIIIIANSKPEVTYIVEVIAK